MFKIQIQILILLFNLMTKIYIVNSSRRSFNCSNNKLIYDQYFCDGVNDCGDGSDESYGCDEVICGEGMFTCKNSNCISISKRCNKMNDCADGSDELFCDHKFDEKDCVESNGKYLCKDKLRCIDLAYVCDGSAHCFDDSDENGYCLQFDFNVCNNCPHTCFRTPDGAKCFCNSSNYEYDTLCKEMKECQFSDSKYNCDQRCVAYQETEQCSCGENYYQLFLEGGCFNKVSYEDLLIYSTVDEIKILNRTTMEISTINHSWIGCTALTAAHDYVYFAVIVSGEEQILKTSLTDEGTSREMDLVVNTEINTVNSIAIDWITNNVYFTTRVSLSVCTNDGRICTELKSMIFGSGHVSVAPTHGLMFWSLNTENKFVKSCILKSSMDGSNEHVFIDNHLRYAVSLTADESSERLYWLDRELRRIETVKFNGKGRGVIPVFPDLRQNIYRFTMHDYEFYWTLESNNTIFIDSGSINYDSIKDNITDENTTSVTHLFAYNPLLQRTKIANPCPSSCSGLCLLRPSTKGLNYTCICEHFKHTDEQHWCYDDSIKAELQTEEDLLDEEIIPDNVAPTVSKDDKIPVVLFVMVTVVALLCIGFFFGFPQVVPE